MSNYTISQTRDQIEINGGSKPILYRVRGIEMPELSDMSFAVWHLLPFAMRDGSSIHIDGPVDPVILEKAERMSRTWEMWRPREFRSVKVTALPSQAGPTDRTGDLSMFSGGIDSTYMFLEHGRRQSPSAALTVQGMEYSHKADEQFERAVRHVQPLLDELNYYRLTVNSNLRELTRGYHSYACVIAGYAFLFRDVFAKAYFAADLSWEQDLAHFPWSLNHVTNRYFEGSGFACLAVNDQVTRAQKVERIAQDPVALTSLSFCTDKAIRPDNCGKCKKCLRTKAMFVGMTGAIPAGVFIDEQKPSLSIKDLTGSEQSFLVDLYQRARDKGHLAEVAGLENAMRSLQAKASWRARIKRLIRR